MKEGDFAMMTNLMMTEERTVKAVDEIGVLVCNANLCGMKYLTIEKPEEAVIAVIKSLPRYEVKDMKDLIRITW